MPPRELPRHRQVSPFRDRSRGKPVHPLPWQPPDTELPGPAEPELTRQRFQRERNHRAPHRESRVPQRPVQPDRRPHSRPDSVRANQQIGVFRSTIGEFGDDPIPFGTHTSAGSTEPHHIRIEQAGKGVDQPGPVYGDPVAANGIHNRVGHLIERPAGGAEHRHTRRRAAYRPHRRSGTDRVQRPEPVGPQGKPRAFPAQSVRPLVDLGRNPLAAQRDRGGQSGGTGADDDRFHARMVFSSSSETRPS